MSVSSEARIRANRLNAQKSTGPKTERGKERSRANAVKHGLTGEGLALPTEDAAEVERRFLAVQEEMAPQTVIGAFLAHRVALMTVRSQRAASHEAAVLKTKIRRAATDFDEARNADADHLLGWIQSEPISHRRKLMATPEGVDRLIGALVGLRDDLENQPTVQWNYLHCQKVEAYFGRRSSDIPHSRGYILSNVIEGKFDGINPEEIAQLSTESEKRNWACDQMVVYIDAEVERLRAHRETLDHKAIALDRAEAGRRAQFDASNEAILARRYEAAATREFYRALREFREVEATGEDRAEALEALESSEATEATLEAGDSIEIAQVEDDSASETIEPKSLRDNDLESPLGSFGRITSANSNPFDWTTRPARADLLGDPRTPNSARLNGSSPGLIRFHESQEFPALQTEGLQVANG